jgi:hypothetical protein
MESKPFWIIEDFDRDNSFQLLAEAAKAQGSEVHTLKYVPFDEGILDQFSNEDRCVIFQGSIQFTEKVQKYRPKWQPGAWATWENFECTEYYSRWGKYLFNQNYMMMPLAEVARRKEALLDFFHGSFFMRPSANSKSFTGTVINPQRQTWDEWGFIMNEAKQNELVVMAHEHLIHKEWRVICTAKEAFTGSRYKTHGKTDYKKEFPEAVKKYAQDILDNTDWVPDPIFVMDICEDGNKELSLLEIGAFSCAGLYHCDFDMIVERANSIGLASFVQEE